MSATTVTADRLRKLTGRDPIDWLTTDDLVREAKFPTRAAARKFLYRHAVPFSNRGRTVLVDRRDFDAALRRMSKQQKAAS